MTLELHDGLLHAPMEVHGRIVNASNNTLLVELEVTGESLLAIYKPRIGERPLWDFPPGSLHRREIAAFEVSAALGWDIVPLTVLRDGPLGPGSVQLFVDHDPRRHYFTLADDAAHADALARMAAFDLVVNNADRKAGHVLLDGDGHIWGCDHGLTFHVQPKLRTVIWEQQGRHLDAAWRDDLQRVAADMDAATAGLGQRLAQLLAPEEIAVLQLRATALSRSGILPTVADDERAYPWPPV